VAELSPVEEALSDARLVSDEGLAGFRVGEDQSVEQALKSPENRTLITHFVEALPPNRRSGIVGKDGEITPKGLQRLKAAMFAKTYPGEAGFRLTESFLESVDPQVRNVQIAMFANLPQMAKAEGLVRAGTREASLSIGEDLAKAVNALAWTKQKGLKVSEFLKQQSMWERPLTPFQENLLQYLGEYSRSPKRMRGLLDQYAQLVDASPDPRQMGMFGGEPPTKEALLEQAAKRQEAEYGPGRRASGTRSRRSTTGGRAASHSPRIKGNPRFL
jgi:hypothetical protein